MAMSVQKSSACPATRPWAVVDDAGEVMACHPTESAARDAMAKMDMDAGMGSGMSAGGGRSADRYGQHGHAIMHPDAKIRDKARRYIDGQLPDLPPMPGRE